MVPCVGHRGCFQKGVSGTCFLRQLQETEEKKKNLFFQQMGLCLLKNTVEEQTFSLRKVEGLLEEKEDFNCL